MWRWQPVLALVVGAALFPVTEAGVGAGTRATLPAVNVQISLPVSAVRLFPGGGYEGAATVANDGTRPALIHLYGAVAVNRVSGSIDLIPNRSWIHLSAYSLRVPAREARHVTFFVRAPKDAKPGMYVFALSGESRPVGSKLGSDTSSLQVFVTYRAVALLAVVVPGHMATRLSLHGWFNRPDRARRYDYVGTRLMNRGNAYTYVTSELLLWDRGRARVFRNGTALILARSWMNVGFYVPWQDVGPGTVGTVVLHSSSGVQSVSGPVRRSGVHRS